MGNLFVFLVRERAPSTTEFFSLPITFLSASFFRIIVINWTPLGTLCRRAIMHESKSRLMHFQQIWLFLRLLCKAMYLEYLLNKFVRKITRFPLNVWQESINKNPIRFFLRSHRAFARKRPILIWLKFKVKISRRFCTIALIFPGDETGSVCANGRAEMTKGNNKSMGG